MIDAGGGVNAASYAPAGGVSNYDPATNSLILAGIGNNPMNLGRKTYYRDFAPRLGLAYRVDPTTVIRAGFGISWIPFPDNKYAWDNFPIRQSNSYTSLGSYGQEQTSTGVYGSMATGFPGPRGVLCIRNSPRTRTPPSAMQDTATTTTASRSSSTGASAAAS